MDKDVEELIGKVLSALGEKPSAEESAKAQTLLLAEVLRELARLRGEVRRIADEDDEDSDDKDDDHRDDDNEDEDEDRRSRRGGRDDVELFV
jgi:hypothetical protein